MLQLTKRTEYGLIALIHMADRAGQVVSVREISEHYPVPRRLLAEVVKDLGRAGLVESQRGATGGYALARPADRITLGDVVVALEGAPAVTSCESHGDTVGSTCEVESVCPIRSPLQRLREGIWRLMERTTLQSLGSAEPFVALDSSGLHLTALPSAYGRAATPGARSVPAHIRPEIGQSPTILS
ncbi:MAG: Rrf2 family transcriptional regulator [Planctomycetota bacterium]|nr:Rrf2 family transcriptional regulator [Planctomycetota bacterium]